MLPDPRHHTPYSDPGRFAGLVDALEPDIEVLAAIARNVIGHYRVDWTELPADRRSDIDSRRLARILEVDQARHPIPLDQPRPPADRVAGCCRDHSLFVVGALRQHGVPARNRVGFSGYLGPGYHYDHVVVEYHDGDRWVMTDAEFAAGSLPFDVRDMTHGIGEPFETAAEVWLALRSDRIDPSTYGVFPGSELSGPDFIAAYVVFEIAHRFGHELLLWDNWGVDGDPVTPDELDRLAGLLVAADGGDAEAERSLFEEFRTDRRLHPGDTITRYSPFGLPPVVESPTAP